MKSFDYFERLNHFECGLLQCLIKMVCEGKSDSKLFRPILLKELEGRTHQEGQWHKTLSVEVHCPNA